MTQPTALELADALTTQPDCTCRATSYFECGCDAIWPEQWTDHAATELRRLHGELERCKQVCAATAEAWREDSGDLRLHRDLLLGALDVVLDDLMYKDHQRVIDVARAAIAIVEGEKT